MMNIVESTGIYHRFVRQEKKTTKHIEKISKKKKKNDSENNVFLP